MLYFSRYNPETDKLGMSYSEFKTEDLGKLGQLSIFILEKLTLLDVHRNVGEDNKYMRYFIFFIIIQLILFC